MKTKILQSKDIDNTLFLRHIFLINYSLSRSASITDFYLPFNLIKDKAKKLIKMGYIDGCPCGCRGNFQLTIKGKIFIGFGDK